MECRVFETFQKRSKNFQNSHQKRTKQFSKESKSVLNSLRNFFGGNFFEKFLPSFPWGVESSKIFKKKQRIFKVPKKPKIVTKSVQTCFELVLGQLFPKKMLSQCSMEARVFENFQKNQKKFKIPKMPKIVPKSIQTWFEQVLGQVFRKIFAQFSMECRVFETFQKKSKNFQNSNQKRTKPFPKESKSVLNKFWGKFFEKFLPSFPWGVESSKIFKKKTKNFQSSKKAENRYQKCPNVF